MKKILVLFKTHLDVGFTDLSRNIIEKYNENYIPKAIEVAKELHEKGTKEGFIWTTGSWLISQYLKAADSEQTAALEEAIKNRWIRWHALPVTTHSEVASKSLFEYGISIAKDLDARYGVKSIGAKMTDVPGHTRAIVPLLKNAGIEFLHIGVNPASCALDVPDFFRWQAPTGEVINVMYNKGDYGEFTEIPNTGVGVYFAHTGDNLGPTSAQEVIEVYEKLHNQYPTAEIVAADLNDLALAVREIENDLPVLTNEFGDTWIHGVGTDPKKLSIYRSLLRLADEVDEATRRKMYEQLLMVAEHTWGVDIKIWLADSEHFSREALQKCRNLPNFKLCEESWEEQRDYVYSALYSITDPEIRTKAQALSKEYKAEIPDFTSYQEVKGEISLNGTDIKWDNEGIYYLSRNGKSVASKEHKIGVFRYDVYGDTHIKEFFRGRYGKPALHYEWWAMEDFMKPGLDKTICDNYFTVGNIKNAFSDGENLFLIYSNDKTAMEKYGCPENLVLKVTPTQNGCNFDLIWKNKPASRIPEALWLSFDLVKPVTGITKLGEVIKPQEVISKGNRELHATEGNIYFGDVVLNTVDAPLIAVEKPVIYGFYNQLPDTKKGIWVNLFNNQWGTNFPQWYDEDARFRFELEF